METRQSIEALKEQLHVPFVEKLKILPSFFGIRFSEEPYYTIVKSDGEFEIRKYDPVTLASIAIPGKYDLAVEEGFFRLADYIFGKNVLQNQVRRASAQTQHEELPMTTPVLVEKTPDAWMVSFVLPKEYNKKNAPVPEDGEIHVHREPVKTLAVHRYSGSQDQVKMEEKSKELLKWLEDHPEYRPISSVQCAQYDGPITMPFLRRNEVMVRVERVYPH